MPPKPRKKRVPRLNYTTNQNIGWHVSYRDPKTGMPRRYRFGMVSQEHAEREYHAWVASHLRGETPGVKPPRPRNKLKLPPLEGAGGGVAVDIVPGSLLDIASGLLRFEMSRVRKTRSQRRQGTICQDVYEQRVRYRGLGMLPYCSEFRARRSSGTPRPCGPQLSI